MLKKLFHGKNKFITLFVLAVIVIVVLNMLYGIIKNTELSMTSYVASRQYPSYPKINYAGKTAAQIAQLKRGEYVVKAGDCIACHTAPTKDSKPYAGGLPIQTPFGVIYSPNITPDRKTGIGAWTDDDFFTAMHDGINPDGQFYYPAFPYLYFNLITKDDLRAIRAYLRMIPAVEQQNIAPDMIFPFNIRFVQFGWRMLFFYSQRTGAYVQDTSQSKTWNIGKYIVQGPGHCAMCHTPSYYLLDKNVSMGAPIRQYDLTGQVVEGYLAPNITKSNLGAIPDKDLLNIFTKYRLIGGSRVEGPMAEAIHDSLIHLSNEDLLGIIEYLKTVDSKIPKQPHVTASASGASVFNNYCAGCHLSGVGGAPVVGNTKSWETLARSGMGKLYRVAINGGGNMPARGTCITCTNDELRDAVDYMVATSKQKTKHPIKTPIQVPTSQQNYQRHCSTCHSNTSSNAPQLNDQAKWQAIDSKGYLAAYRKIMSDKSHPKNAGCSKCTDAQILSALKYMMQRGSGKSYLLW